MAWPIGHYKAGELDPDEGFVGVFSNMRLKAWVELQTLGSRTIKSPSSHSYQCPFTLRDPFLPRDWKAPESTKRKRREVRSHHPGCVLLSQGDWTTGVSPTPLLGWEYSRGPGKAVLPFKRSDTQNI